MPDPLASDFLILVLAARTSRGRSPCPRPRRRRCREVPRLRRRCRPPRPSRRRRPPRRSHSALPADPAIYRLETSVIGEGSQRVRSTRELPSSRLRLVARPRARSFVLVRHAVRAPSSCSCACHRRRRGAPTSRSSKLREIAPLLRPAPSSSTSTCRRLHAARRARVLGQNGARPTTSASRRTPSSSARARAVRDFLQPHRIVIGCDDHGHRRPRLRALPAASQRRCVVTDPASAEMIKHARRTRSSPPRSRSSTPSPTLCEAVNADVRDVALGMGYDPRIGSEFLQPGPGFGGACLPKDTAALAAHRRSRPATTSPSCAACSR